MSSGMWYRTLVYLGLKEEPEAGYDDLPERQVAADPVPGRAGGSSRRVADEHARFDPVDDPDLRLHRGSPAEADDGGSNVRQLRGATPAVAPADVRLAVVEIAAFDDVEQVGSRYRAGHPVLFDVSGADRAAARRVIDFVAGLTYASRGRMDRVGTRAFLLVPDGVVLPEHEEQRLSALGYRLPGGRS